MKELVYLFFMSIYFAYPLIFFFVFFSLFYHRYLISMIEEFCMRGNEIPELYNVQKNIQKLRFFFHQRNKTYKLDRRKYGYDRVQSLTSKNSD